MRVAMLALAFALAISGPVAAGPYEDAMAAYDRQDYALAVQWYRKAADQGVADAQSNLGIMYLYGRGVTKDYAQAAQLFRKAADQGDAGGQANLGQMYYNGQGVPKDYAQAVHWYRKAADQGNVDGRHRLGLMYANGTGVPKDYVLAYMWYDLSTAAGLLSTVGDPDVREVAQKARDATAAMMTPAQIGEAQRLSREWKPTSQR